jgi:hypothetical protein
MEAEAMVIPLLPDEGLLDDVARGLNAGSMIEQANSVLVEAAYGFGYHREESDVEGFVWACVLNLSRRL